MRLFFISLLFPLVAIAQAIPEATDVAQNPSEQSVEQESSTSDISLTDDGEQQTPPNQNNDFTPNEEISEDFPVSIPYDI
ncbi:MAG: Uncharacterised protein [Porticoccaceae bacterium UBA1117]|nr:MAG: Uncharacterised protein [Porticoccaceae bacterium UBA1117]